MFSTHSSFSESVLNYSSSIVSNGYRVSPSWSHSCWRSLSSSCRSPRLLLCSAIQPCQMSAASAAGAQMRRCCSSAIPLAGVANVRRCRTGSMLAALSRARFAIQKSAFAKVCPGKRVPFAEIRFRESPFIGVRADRNPGRASQFCNVCGFVLSLVASGHHGDAVTYQHTWTTSQTY